MRLTIFFIALVFSAHSFGEFKLTEQECSTIQLDAEGETLENHPFLGQGSTGTCYSHASSKLIDHHIMKTEGVPFHSSPMVNAILFQAAINGDDLYGGNNNCQLLNTANREGVCPREKFEGTFKVKDFEPLLMELSRIYKSYSKGRSKKKDAIVARIQKKLERKHKLESTKPPTTIQVQNSLDQGSFGDFLKVLLVDSYCPDRKIMNTPISCDEKRIFSPDESESSRSIHQGLEHGNPTAIEICGNVLSNSSYVGVNWESEDLARGNRNATASAGGDDPCRAHWLTVIGREWQNGSCHFKLYDSMNSRSFTEGKISISEKKIGLNIFQYTSIYSFSESLRGKRQLVKPGEVGSAQTYQLGGSRDGERKFREPETYTTSEVLADE
ncbi:MAG: hypothetical protein HOE90_17765 [Bacteriovoracaceae bacterium]|nr:hypothetical protein [Bacteriovoracaceae bacterium]